MERKMTLKTIVWIVASLGSLMTSSAGAEIRIGMAGPMTGAYAWLGEQYERGT